MASKAFKAALAAMKESKSVDSILVGTAGNYLPEGTTEVVIQVVDTAKMDEGFVEVTYQAEDSKSHRERVYLMKADNSELSFSLRRLLSATIPDTGIIGQLLDKMEDDDNALAALTGMKAKITLAFGDGFTVKTLGNGMYAAFDRGSDNKITDEFENIDDAKDAAKATGMRQSFLNVKRLEATHKEANCDAIRLYFTGAAKPPVASSGAGGTQFTAGAAVAKTI